MKSVLIVNDRFDSLGGAERHVLWLAGALSERGIEVSTLSPPDAPRDASLSNQDREIPRPGRLRHDLRSLSRIGKVLRQLNPTVIHLHNTEDMFGPLRYRSMVRRWPLVKTIHDVRPFCFNLDKVLPSGDACEFPLGWDCWREGCLPRGFEAGEWVRARCLFRKTLEAREARGFHRVVVSSRYVQELLVSNGLNPDAVRVIPLRIKSGIAITSEPGEYALFASYLDHAKGVTDLLKAASGVRAPGFRLKITGDGPLAGWVSKRIVEDSRLQHTEFLGRVESSQFHSLMDGCRFLILPSRVPETFGLVGIEAMARGKPVLATHVGAVTEWLVDSENGMSIPPRNPKALSDALDRLWQNSEEISRLSHGALETARRYEGQEAYLDSLLKVYHEAIQAGNESNGSVS